MTRFNRKPLPVPSEDPVVRSLRAHAHQYASFRVEMVRNAARDDAAVLAAARAEGMEVFRKAGVLWIRGFRREQAPPEPARRAE